MALLELRRVSKIYRLGGEEIRALDDVSLDIGEGQFISIIGPSGSGKSTLTHILGCLDTPTNGTIKLEGTMIQHASPRQNSIAVDISSCGLGIKTKYVLAEDSIIKFYFPIKKLEKTIPVYAQVMWSMPTNDHFRVGLRFLS